MACKNSVHFVTISARYYGSFAALLRNLNGVTAEFCRAVTNFLPGRVGRAGIFPYLSHATYVLGIIGGVSRRAIKENAVADMYRNAMLTGSQAVANITETAKVRSYILWTRVEYIATGTIVEFTE